MKPKPKQYAKCLMEVISDKDDKNKIKKILKNFIELLAKNNQLSQIDRILKYFIVYWNEQNNVVESEIISSRQLGKNEITKITEYLKSLSEAKDFEVKESVDDKIIGGLIVKYGDKIIDHSIKNRIGELKNKMIR